MRATRKFGVNEMKQSSLAREPLLQAGIHYFPFAGRLRGRANEGSSLNQFKGVL